MLKFLFVFFTSTNTFAQAPSLQYSKDVNPEHVVLLNNDLQRLETLNLQIQDPDFTKVTDLQGPIRSGRAVLQWLAERVRFIVSENFTAQTGLYVERRKYEFQNPGIFPDLNGGKRIAAISNQMIVMQNIGAAYYVMGKEGGVLWGADLKGIGKIPLSSPRVGLVQIGPGLFRLPKDSKYTDLDRSLERIFTLLHEARHSDGNGKNLGMMHFFCPQGHPYSGYAACDLSLNGSYGVEAQFRKAMTESCSECTIAQRERLRLAYLDNFSRILEDDTSASAKETEAAQRKACEELKNYPVKVPMCEELAQKDLYPKPVIKADYLDSKPEGVLEKRKGFFDFFR